jgi:hypothetical protein
MLRRLPKELAKVLDALESKYTVEAFAPLYLGWCAEITIGGRHFQIVLEFKHFFVSETVDGVTKSICPTEGIPSPSRVARTINDALTRQSGGTPGH